MKKEISQTHKDFRKTMRLMRKTLYKTIEFQLLFKFLYIGIILFVIDIFIGLFSNIVDGLITKTHLKDALENSAISFHFDLKLVLILLISLFAFIFVYLIEKNGVIIISSEYYRNNFISFFKTFFLSIRKTPRFIFRRLKQMRIPILIFVVFYILLKILEQFSMLSSITSFLAIILALYGVLLFFALIFRYTFTAYITCLEPKEDPRDFINKMPEKFLRKKTRVSFVFYVLFFVSSILWIILFIFVTRSLLYLSTMYPSFTSTMIAFLVSFTIIGIVIILSLFKTFKVSAMTILYFEARARQKKDISMYTKKKQPKLSQSLFLSIITLLTITVIGGALLTRTIRSRTDYILSNATEYIEYVKNNKHRPETDISSIDLEYLLAQSLSKDNSSLDIIETIVFTYLAFIISQ